MADFKCTNCGAPLQVTEDQTTAFCGQCGARYTLPQTNIRDNTSSTSDAFMKRGFLALEDGEWAKADGFFEQVLNNNPEHGEAYLGKLMAELKINRRENLKNCQKPFDNNNNFQKIQRFGNESLKNEICDYIDYINNRNDIQNKEAQYLKAQKLARSSKSGQKNYLAAEIFFLLGDYKDSAYMAKKCTENAVNATKKSEKRENLSLKIISIGSAALSLLIIVSIILCVVVSPAVRYNNAVELVQQGQHCEALEILSDLKNFKDSKTFYKESMQSLSSNNTIAAGYMHTFAINEDGTVKVTSYEQETYYGYYSYYEPHSCDECDIEYWSDIVSVYASANTTMGLKADGTVITSDSDCYEWESIVAICAGYHHKTGLKADGTVVATGYNDYGQCDVEGWADIVAISAGSYHTVGLKSDGTVVATGNNNSGQCDVEGWADIVAVVTGDHHTVGIKSDGTVVATGDNDYGQCDVEGWTDILAVAAGDYHTVGLKADGTVVATGNNNYGQCDVKGWKNIKTPQK